MPVVLTKIFDISKTTNPKLNQCLVNFYDADGSIGKHCDDEKGIVRNSEIHSWTFGPATRYFELEPMIGTDSVERYKVEVNHNTHLIMGGRCQETHVHQVKKAAQINGDGRRINVTFREFY